MPASSAVAAAEEEYEDDFENTYEEDFESDGELEVPQLQQHQHAPDQDQEEEAASPSASSNSTSTATKDARMWPSLAASIKGRSVQGGPALFGRSLFAATDPAVSPVEASGSSASGAGSAVIITLQPPLPPRTELQRRQALAALNRSKQLYQQQGSKLHLSKQLDLLTLHPVSLHQQYAMGVGVYAGRAAAACQTRQLDQDIREQEGQTDQIEQQQGWCQVPDDLYSTTQQQTQSSSSSTSSTHKQQHQHLLSAATDPAALSEFLGWAVPQVLFELQRAEAEAAAENRLVCAAAGPSFSTVQSTQPLPLKTHLNNNSSSSSSSLGREGTLLAGELQLSAVDNMLQGRSVVGLAGPPTAQAAAAAAAVIAAGAGTAPVSSHLLLVCYAPVTMPAAAAASEHGVAGLGCLCVWDLLQASSGDSPQAQQRAAERGSSSSSAGATPPGVVQLLVSEGRPTSCCWGPGEAACLVFAGMEEGGICCWDLSEPGKAHQRLAESAITQQQQQQQQKLGRGMSLDGGSLLPMRRPSYSTEVPLFVSSIGIGSKNSFLWEGQQQQQLQLDAAGGGSTITALAAVPSSSGRGGAATGSGCVCRLVALTVGGCVSLYSVMVGGAGSDVAVTDLGMRSGSQVWMVKVCEGVSLGPDVIKAPHLKRPAAAAAAAAEVRATSGQDADCSSSQPLVQQQPAAAFACLLVLPGPTQQLLVGTDGGRVLKGSALGTTSPPHTYISAQWWLGGHGLMQDEGSSTAPADTCAVQDCSTSGSSSSSGTAAAHTLMRGSGWQGSGLGLGTVTSLSVCPLLPEAWAAGHSCGRLAVFALGRSRPCWVWQHPLGAPVVAVRWMPQSAALIALFGANPASSSSSSDSDSSCAGSLLAFANLGHATVACKQLQLSAAEALHGPLKDIITRSSGATPPPLHSASSPSPVCMEVVSMSGAHSTVLTSCMAGVEPSPTGSSSTTNKNKAGQAAVRVCVAVGFDDGSSSVYQVGAPWCQPSQEAEASIKSLLSCC